MNQAGMDMEALRRRLSSVYGESRAGKLADRVAALVAAHSPALDRSLPPWVDQHDAMLITYGDSVREAGVAPLRSLQAFLRRFVGDALSAVHLLPFYPYSSDDGFSVIDYRAVNPEVGDWADVEALSGDYQLMFDAVVNHISQQSDWFQAYLAGDDRYQGYFIEGDPDADYSSVTRPRTHPVLTPFATAHGTRHIWTTFSDDQIDLNFANPEVFLEILDLLLFYVARGARLLRFDAIGFIWKRLGSSCIHEPEAHALVQVLRAALDAAAPGVIVITETNVPHRDNISYFGDGGNEAHMVYQFPLPPLTLRAFQTGDASALSDWAAALEPTSAGTTFFNFLASHDGIGVRPVEGILSSTQVADMVSRVEACGGRVSMKDNGDGTQSPYELNINYLDAVSLPSDDDAARARKFLAAQSILLSVVGMPGIYIHSLLGSRNDYQGLRATGRNRSINRQKLDRGPLEAELVTAGHLRQRVLNGHLRMLSRRAGQPAFHPNASQTVLKLDERVFAVLRGQGQEQVLALVNVSGDSLTVEAGGVDLPDGARDLLTEGGVSVRSRTARVRMEPYQTRWIRG